MQPIILTKQQVCQFLLTYHHLTDDTAMIHNDEILDYVHQVGCIQYDPLDVVGRNADLVIQSRCLTYKKGELENFLYKDRYLFDVWDKNMSISSVDEWACFSRFRARHLPWCQKNHETVQQITDYLTQHDFACSSDFNLEGKVDWHYGPQRISKAALECMCYAGLAIVHHKKGSRRYYGLSEKYILKELLNMDDPNKSDEDYCKWTVLRRINSVGVLWNRPSDAWLGTAERGGLKSEKRKIAFDGLMSEGKILGIQVDDMKYPLYIAKENIELLNSVLAESFLSKDARFIAPLDNMLWDRKLIAELFDFQYKWEVYTPVVERKYGYYVLPVLCSDRFIGRIEMETEKKSHTLIVKYFWWEENIKPSTKYRNGITRCLKKFAAYNRCKSVMINCEI